MWPQEARLPLVNPKGFLSTLERKTTTSPYLPLDTYCQKQKPKKLDLDQYQMCHGGSSHCGAAEMNLTRNHEVAGSIPGLAQWVKDSALRWLWYRLEATVLMLPLTWESPYAASEALKNQQNKTKQNRKPNVSWIEGILELQLKHKAWCIHS